jgi:hypothetical protein
MATVALSPILSIATNCRQVLGGNCLPWPPKLSWSNTGATWTRVLAVMAKRQLELRLTMLH